MTAVNLTVDVHCYQPQWVFEEENLKYANSSYRIYINDELLIERKWYLDNNKLIRENLIVKLLPDTTNQLILKSILKDPAQAVFRLDNLQVFDVPFTSEQINDLTISFTL